MTPVSKENVEQVRNTVHGILEAKASKLFLGRIDGMIGEWQAGKLTAAQACEKIQKAVALFIGEDIAKEIGNRCAPVVMRESSQHK